MENHAARSAIVARMAASIALVLAFLYVPLIPVAGCRRSSGCGPANGRLRWYGELWRTPLIVGAIRAPRNGCRAWSAVLAPLLGLLAALSIRELGMPRLILAHHAAAAVHSRRQHGSRQRLAVPAARHRALARHHRHRADAVGAALRDADHPDRDVDFRSACISRPPMWPAPAAGGPFATSSFR